MRKLFILIFFAVSSTVFSQTYVPDTSITQRVYTKIGLRGLQYGGLTLGYQHIHYSGLLNRTINVYGELNGFTGLGNDGRLAGLRVGIILPVIEKRDFKVLYDAGLQYDYVNYRPYFRANAIGLNHNLHVGIFKSRWFLYGSVNYNMGVAMHYDQLDEQTIYPFEQGWNMGLQHNIDLSLTGGYRFRNGIEINASVSSARGLGIGGAWGF